MDAREVDVAVVAERERPLGLVTTHDIVVRGVARRFPVDARIDAVMTEHVVTLSTEATRHEAVEAFRGTQLVHLVLVDDGAAVAVLTREDLALSLADELAGVTGAGAPD